MSTTRVATVRFLRKALIPRRWTANAARVEALAKRPGVWAEVYFATHSGTGAMSGALRKAAARMGYLAECTTRGAERNGRRGRVLYARIAPKGAKKG